MDKCCIVGCEEQVYKILLCAEHDAFSPQNINKPLPSAKIKFVYGDKEIKPIDVEL